MMQSGKITIPEAKWEALESAFNKAEWQASADVFTYALPVSFLSGSAQSSRF
jgi:hypothetical protein